MDIRFVGKRALVTGAGRGLYFIRHRLDFLSGLLITDIFSGIVPYWRKNLRRTGEQEHERYIYIWVFFVFLQPKVRQCVKISKSICQRIICRF